MLDDDLNSSLSAPVDHKNAKIVIEYTYPVPVSIRSATTASREGIPFGRLQVSKDKANYTTLAILPGPHLYHGGKVHAFLLIRRSGLVFSMVAIVILIKLCSN